MAKTIKTDPLNPMLNCAKFPTFPEVFPLFGLKAESEKMLHLDMLRFLAATSIVFFHWRPMWVGLGPALGVSRNSSSWISGNLNFMDLSVDLFFVISGIVMFKIYSQRLFTLADFRIFLRRRVARLYPLHLLTLAALVPIGIAIRYFHFHVDHPNVYDLRGLIPNLTLTQSIPSALLKIFAPNTFNAATWSISAEMVCYILLPLLLVAQRFRFWLPALIGFSGILLNTYVNGNWNWTAEWTVGYGAFRALPSFMFGVSLGASSPKLARIPIPEHLLVLFLGIFFASGWLGTPRAFLLLNIYLIAIVACAADASGITARWVRKLAPLGTLTYSIYMIHGPLGSFTLNPLSKRLSRSAASSHSGIAGIAIDAALIAMYPVLLSISYLSYRYFETPARRWLSGSKSIRVAPVPTAQSNLVTESPVA